MLGTDNGSVRVAIYCRISLARDGDLEKVERQEADCRALCERNGWEVAEVFVDNSRSAWQRNRKRPRWDAMLEGVGQGRFGAIVVYHGDRLIRQPWDLEKLLSLAAERGIRLASPTGTRSLDSADDRFILRIEAAQACRSSDDTSRRTSRAKRARREQGVATLGRTRAFGREADGSICEAEAVAIRDVFARLVAGETKSSLWKEWVRIGVPTVGGKTWLYASFAQVLTRPDLAGLVSYRGQALGVASNLKPIVDRELWETVQTLLGRTAGAYPAGPRPRKHLLSGIAVCAACGKAVGSNPLKPESRSRYRCLNPACPAPTSRVMMHLDEYVIGFTLERLSDPELPLQLERVSAAAAAGSQHVVAELAALQARREATIKTFAKSRMTPEELDGVLADFDAQIDQARARIAGGQVSHVLDGLAGLDRAGWDALPLDRRRAIVRKLCTIRLLPGIPGPGFKEETVELRDVKVDADAGKGAGGGLELVASVGGPAPE